MKTEYILYTFCILLKFWRMKFHYFIYVMVKTSYPYLLNPCSLYIFAIQLYSVHNQSHLEALDTIIKRNTKNESPVNKH